MANLVHFALAVLSVVSLLIVRTSKRREGPSVHRQSVPTRDPRGSTIMLSQPFSLNNSDDLTPWRSHSDSAQESL
jgi:hypothetical protein